MNSTVTLTNSSEFYLSNEEVFLRGIPTAINVGSLTTDALRLLVFYVAKSGPYKLAVESGFFTGTLEEWLNSLHGTGEGAGIQGPKGKSAYELYVESVQAPAEALSLVDWLNSLVGAQGAKGTTGDQGLKGDKGEDGVDGLDGKSAYQLALAANPAIGTEVEWLASLKGATGDVGAKGTDGLQGLKGDKGDPGIQGVKGDDGADGVTQNATTITFTGLVTDTATPVLDTDTLLVVIGKLQAQITALEARVRVTALEAV